MMGSMWNDLMHLSMSVPEKLVRTAAVYLVIALLLRLAGKRDLAQLNTFDLVVMLLLSNVVQNAVIGNNNTLIGGLIGAGFLVLLNAVISRMVSRYEPASRLLEGTATPLLADGVWDQRALRREGVAVTDVEVAMRRQGAHDASDLKSVTLEAGGSLTIEPREDVRPATVGELRRLEAKIDLLLARSS